MSRHWRLGIAFALLAPAGCSDPSDPGSRVATIESIGGNNQVGAPGTLLPVPLAVRVTANSGRGIAGVRLWFESPEFGSVGPIVSDESGEARAEIRLPPIPGVIAVDVRAGEARRRAVFTLLVREDPVVVRLDGLERGWIGVPYRGRLVAHGGQGPYSFQGDGLPPGLVLESDGTLAGSPSAVGEYRPTWTVRDGAGRSTAMSSDFVVCPGEWGGVVGEAVEVPLTGCGLLLATAGAPAAYRVAIMNTKGSGSEPASGRARLTLSGVASSRGQPTRQRTTGTHEGGRSREASVPRAISLDLETLRGALNRTRDPMARPSPGPIDVVDLHRNPVMASAAPPSTIRVISSRDGCEGVAAPPRAAHLVARGGGIAVYQDSVQAGSDPLSTDEAGLAIDHYRSFGGPVMAEFFGEPSDVDGSETVIVLVTPEMREGVAAYVWSGDLYSREACPNSNEMEVIYFSRAAFDPDPAAAAAPHTLVHEVKHLVTLAGRIRAIVGGRADRFHPAWVEEGSAELAVEIAARRAWSVEGGPGTGELATGLDVSRSGTSLGWNGVRGRLDRMARVLRSSPNSLLSNPPGSPPGHDFRGGAWLVFRYLLDAHLDGTSPPARGLLLSLADSMSGDWVPIAEETIGTTLSEMLWEVSALLGAAGECTSRCMKTYDLASAASAVVRDQGSGPFPWAEAWVRSGSAGGPGDTGRSLLLAAGGLKFFDVSFGESAMHTEVSADGPPGTRVRVWRLR